MVDEIPVKLQSMLDAQIGKGNVFNAVTAMQSRDRTLDFKGSAGIADSLSGAPMTTDTPYFIASVTKMYTAAIIMRLSQEHRISLDAPITDYLSPSFTRGIHVYQGRDFSGQIRVWQLVTHTSGLADHETDKPRGGRSVMDELKAGQDRAIDTNEALEIVRSLSPRFLPGTPGKAHYSNTNYRLLGEIIEAVTDQPMRANYEEKILAPLGLHRTYLYDWTAPRADAPPATVYFKDEPAVIPKYISSNVSDGGLVSTAPECLAFLRAFFEGHLFDKALLDRMFSWNAIFFPLKYGYGLMHFRLPRSFWPRPLPEFIGHSGSTGSFAFLCPSRGLYLAGTLNQVASPARPFFLMINLVRAVGSSAAYSRAKSESGHMAA